MYSQHKKFILSDPKFLPFFIPQKFREEKIFPLLVRSFQKNEINLESYSYEIYDLQQCFFLCLENRFWFYEKSPLFENQEFSFSFQGVDFLNKSFLFSNRKKKLTGSFSFLSRIRESKQLSNRAKVETLVKSRLLRLTRGGFLSSCFGSSAYIIRSSYFYKLRKHSSYRGWFSLNFCYYGLLSYFSLLRFDKRIAAYSKDYLNKFVSRKVNFYYIKNNNFKFFILLGKPKAF